MLSLKKEENGAAHSRLARFSRVPGLKARQYATVLFKSSMQIPPQPTCAVAVLAGSSGIFTGYTLCVTNCRTISSSTSSEVR